MQQIAVRGMQFDALDAQRMDPLGGGDKRGFTCSKPASSSAIGTVSPGAWAIADGAPVCQPPSDKCTQLPPCHGARLDALRPA